MIVTFTKIVWDTEGADVDLPKEVEMKLDDTHTDIELEGADLLSDKFGWCVESFKFKIEVKEESHEQRN